MTQKPRTMWVWETEELIKKDTEKRLFFCFCKGKNVREIFLQLPLSYKGKTERNIKCRIEFADKLRRFLKEASREGIKVHGLDGHPSFAVRRSHPRVMSIVKAVIDFNKGSAPKERFYGIHFDNEPYLLPAFQSQLRKKILMEFLDVNKKCADLIRSKGKGLVYGVDIPFWFAESVENMDEETSYIVPFGGKTKPASFHLLDICDNIGIMDYRNSAGGPDGLIAHGTQELVCAESSGKNVYVGVETSRYPDSTVTYLYGLEKPEFNRQFEKVEKELEDGIYYDGFKLRLLKDAVHIHPGLVVSSETRHHVYEDTLLKLARCLGCNFSSTAPETIDRMVFDLKSMLKNNIELRGFTQSEWEGTKTGEHYVFFETDEIMLPKISFAGKDEHMLEDELKEAEAEFSKYSSFCGFAIHHYKSYQELCTGIYL